MPRVAVLATGGTIASRAVGTGAVATDDASDIVRAVRHGGGIDVEARDVLRKNSFALTLADLRALALAVRETLDDPSIDGVVVTHGTDTLEESAYLVDLGHDDPRPVVFTGAQRAADSDDPDGPGNIADAVAVAAAPSSRDRGVLVSFAGEIFAARGVRKQHTVAPQPFGAPEIGKVGMVEGARVEFTASPQPRQLLALPDERFDSVRVDVVSAYPGADAGLLRAAERSGADGVLIIGTGAGNTTPAMIPAIRELVAGGRLVALGTRANAGPVVPLYGGGGGVDAVDAGAVPMGTIGVAQGRILCALLLSQFPAADAGRRLAKFALDSVPPEHLITVKGTSL